ncbi:MAG: hypothetical protein JWN44_4988 [Myxococcales bacterium]|nr:hypothetical protein [Myxococcales bacterium]
MSRLGRLITVSVLVAPLFLAAGCKQGIGERCQVMSDCDDGLNCVLPAGGTAQAGGTCQMPNSGNSDMAADMTAVPSDLSHVDMTQAAD